MNPNLPCPMTEPASAPMTASRGGDLWQRYRRSTTDTEVEGELVEHYLPLVKAVVGRLAMTLPAHASIEDLHSAGLVGLLQALRSYRPGSAASFETFARFRIRGAVLDELRRMDWVPRSVHDKARKLQEVMMDLEQRHGRNPTDQEMADEMELSLEEYRHLLDEVRPAAFVHLDSVLQNDGSDPTPLHEFISDEEQESPPEMTSRRELVQLVLKKLERLPEMQRKVLALYYCEDLRLKEIAAVFGLTESRICQIHGQAILAIRGFIERYESAITLS
jgi:RNA polymerase sigma factor FliA